MSTIYFDEESRVFSVVELQNNYSGTKKPNAVINYMKSHPTMISSIAGAAVGAGGSAIIAKMKARKLGLKPGSKEYKKFMAKYIAIGAGSGAGIGAVGSEIHKIGSHAKAIKKANEMEGNPMSNKEALSEAWHQRKFRFKAPFRNLKNKFNKKNKK